MKAKEIKNPISQEQQDRQKRVADYFLYSIGITKDQVKEESAKFMQKKKEKQQPVLVSCE